VGQRKSTGATGNDAVRNAAAAKQNNNSQKGPTSPGKGTYENLKRNKRGPSWRNREEAEREKERRRQRNADEIKV
jgi:hypothetical protein